MARPPLRVRVVSPQEVVFEDEAAAVVAPAWDGFVGILPGHAPMLSLVGEGVFRAELPGGGTETFRVSGGVLKVDKGRVTLLTEKVASD